MLACQTLLRQGSLDETDNLTYWQIYKKAWMILDSSLAI